MFISCCTPSPTSTDVRFSAEAIEVDQQQSASPSPTDALPESDTAHPEDNPAACPEPLVTDGAQTNEIQVAMDTPALKEEPMISVVDVITKEQAVSDEPAVKAELVRVSPKVFTVDATLKPGALGVKFHGVMVVDVAPASQASSAGIRKGDKVLTFGGESVPKDADATKLSQWLLEKLRSPRPVLVQFDRPVLETSISDGPLGLKFNGCKVIEVTPGLQASTAGVRIGCNLLSFGAEPVPHGKSKAQLTEWLQQQLTAPRPVVIVFEHP